MQVTIKHVGYCPVRDEHNYVILCENGHADMLFEHVFISDGIIELDDRLWDENSGWADIQCDCGHEYRERVWRGGSCTCPVCGTVEHIPIDAVLEESNLHEINSDF